MDIETIIEFIARATIRTLVFVRDDDGNLDDPTNVLITWIDAEGTKKVNQEDIVSSGRLEEGIFEHYYNTTQDSAKGWWQGLAEVIDGSGEGAYNSPVQFSVRVK